MNKIKPFQNYDEQINILEKRGCVIEDASYARSILEKVNYYRLSAYFLPFKKPDGGYRSGTTFSKIFNIYEFDRKLRNVLFGALARIEIYFRSKITYHHADKYGAVGYLENTSFNKKHNHENFIKQIKSGIEKNKKILFIKHHIENYDRQFPLWVVSELFTFGMLSRFYADLLTADQKILAKEISLTPRILNS